MNYPLLSDKIASNLPYKPTDEQQMMLESLISFLYSRNESSLYLLKGYAGTGKSSLIGGVVQSILQLQQKVVLLAPTGRAARVFAHYAGVEAQTIHRKIYRQKSYSSESYESTMNLNVHRDTLFLIDEASMISNRSNDNPTSGGNSLLEDLMEYIYSGENCRVILIGDTAQLPPVGQSESPALSHSYMSGFGLDVHEFTLTHVVRQAEKSGILQNATLLRERMNHDEVYELPQLDLDGFKDIKAISGEEFIDDLNSSYNRSGVDETLIITRSNKRAKLYNQGVRARVRYMEEELSTGDLILVAKNNYFVSTAYREIDFIANGEIAEVLRVRRREEIYGFTFAEVTLRLIDRDMTIDMKVIVDSLHSETPALSTEQQSKLFYAVAEDYTHLGSQNVVLRKVKQDSYYNALQVKFAYCLTCHKSQGGQWKEVYIDLGNINPEHLGLDFYRWLYTAMTRATERVYLVNMPDEMRLKG